MAIEDTHNQSIIEWNRGVKINLTFPNSQVRNNRAGALKMDFTETSFTAQKITRTSFQLTKGD